VWCAVLCACVAVDLESHFEYVHVDRLGVGVAYVYSLIAALMPNLFPHAFRGHNGAVPVYFEAAAVITTLVLLGLVLELRARNPNRCAIKALLIWLQPSLDG
jgi:cation transport ATPase